MDAPPAQEDSLPFVRVAGYLEAMGLNAPRILEADIDRGLLLLTDLGSTDYLQQLKADSATRTRLYADALAALGTLQTHGAAYQSLLPPYDEALLRRELALFHDWLCERHLGIDLSAAERTNWQELCELLVRNALDQPQVFVHRDFHSRNLMVTRSGNPGILDFQDAVEGPLTYDLVSLLKDCYIRLTPIEVETLSGDFIGQLDAGLGAQLDAPLILRWADLMGVQRHLKAAGIFARLNHRDGKPAYMADVPRTLGYVTALRSRYPELEFVAELIERRCLPMLAASS